MQNEQRMTINLSPDAILEIKDFGTSNYEWRVCHRATGEPSPTIRELFGPPNGETPEFYAGINTLGVALVWAEPATFASLVRDLLNNFEAVYQP